MGEILKNGTKKLATLCQCRQFLPDEINVRHCQKKCEAWDERRDGWCLWYEKDSQMCTHIENDSTQKEDKEDTEKPSANLIKNLYKGV